MKNVLLNVENRAKILVTEGKKNVRVLLHANAAIGFSKYDTH